MKSTQYSSRGSEWAGDLAVWLRENAEDNSEQLARLHKNLRRAREQELTFRQRQIVEYLAVAVRHELLEHIIKGLRLLFHRLCRTGRTGLPIILLRISGARRI